MSAGYTRIALDDLSSKSSLDEQHVQREEKDVVERTRTDPRKNVKFVTLVLGLVITCVFSASFLAGSKRHWTVKCPSRFCAIASQKRATLQMIIQTLSHVLGMLQVSTVVTLINRAARLYWKSNGITLDILQSWVSLSTRSISWGLPLGRVFLVLSFISLTTMPAAFWAGVITPVPSTFVTSDMLLIPGYHNTSYIREWPSSALAQPPLVSNEYGIFSYSVGSQMHAKLLYTAASSSTTDGRQRPHKKHDLSQFTYVGRSYGVGGSVGLEDKTVQNEWSHSYDYHETGLLTSVKCGYNARSNYQIRSTNNSAIYRTSGKLQRNDDTAPEDSIHLGLSSDSMVAIGVPPTPQDFRRILGFAAGKNYAYLNTLQCSFAFEPTLFHASVNLREKIITVAPLYPIRQFYPDSTNLTYTLLRQFAIIANLQTSTRVSALGEALSQSITNYVQNSRAHGNTHPAYSFKSATLSGVETALAAMADDMLVAYAGAQMYIQKDRKEVSITVTRTAFRFGEDMYIYIVCGVNLFVVCCVVVECVRTKNWKDLPELDYADTGAMIVASARTYDEDDDILKGRAADMGALQIRLAPGGRVLLERREEVQSLQEDVDIDAS
ncbi:hypothetical protein FB567DRAFT_276885 [Paraphoma chrysanthemicola]|uniref:Uncharacterized protein n=1 Tax=Paraphoma chrysanthemicola TaxID=798071 RepID=A0A8K0REU6_9PLEO|nr:hypothetical protein FB567DRAFT_276885 [Paraphoma chrysanthemicola]